VISLPTIGSSACSRLELGENCPVFTIDLVTQGPLNQPPVPGDCPVSPLKVGVARAFIALAVLSGVACGGSSTSYEDSERSMRQYELAVGLRGEGNVPGALQTLYKALDMDPSNARAHLLLANMFLLDRQDNLAMYDEKAEHHFNEVLRIQESDAKKPEQSLVAEARNGLGVLRIHQGRYQEAVDYLMKAVEDIFNRDAYMAWGNLGWAYFYLGKYEKAAESLVRSVKLHPRFCVGYFRLGSTYLKMKQFEKAEQSLTSAISVDERCAAFQDAFHLRGEARMNLGTREDARADFERCVEIEANNDTGKSCSRYLEATY
jgi:type IV pilus assembly protein PilF